IARRRLARMAARPRGERPSPVGAEDSVDGWDGLLGCELHAVKHASSTQTPTHNKGSPFGVAAPGERGALSVEAGDHILHQLRLAVAARLELGKGLEALLQPLVVHAVLGARRIELMRLDRRLREREDLL